MNKHKNKNRTPAVPVLNRRQIDIDGMPPQVALEMLCAPKARLTNRQRKICRAARSKIFESTLQAKPVEATLAAKFRRATWVQICKWQKRTEAWGALLESAYSKALKERHSLAHLEADRNNPPSSTMIQARIIILDKIIAALELKRADLMLFSDSLRAERENRETNIRFLAGLKKVAPTIAAALEPALGVACGDAS